MKTLASLLVASALASSLQAEDTSSDAAPAIDPNATIEMVANHFAQLSAAAKLDGSDTPSKRSRRGRSEARSGLQTSSLGTSSLQLSNALDSSALGLTSAADWNRMFPHKKE